MKVSIALCTFNGEKYIQEQLESLLNQSSLPDEIIISDDGSTDRTLEIIEDTLKDTKIPYQLFKQNPSLGVFRNFEFCLRECSGDLIFPCDQDDVWKKDKIKKHVEMHNHHPNMHIVYSNAEVVLNTIETVLYPLWDIKSIQYQRYSSITNLLYKGRSVAGFCQSIRRDFLSQLFPFPDGIYHDDWMISCASLDQGILGIPESLAYYRQHGDNVVGIIRGSKLSYWKSLFTNAKFYVESYRYIYDRHEKMFKALSERKDLNELLNHTEIQKTLSLYRAKSCLKEMTFRSIVALQFKNLINGAYHKHNGIFGYFKDVYNLAVMRIFVK